MEDVSHSTTCAMESSSVSMAQMSPAAVEVSMTNTKTFKVSTEHSSNTGKNKVTEKVYSMVTFCIQLRRTY